VNATTLTGTTVSVTGNITGGNLSGTSIVGTLTTAAQTNITSVGQLTTLNVAGNMGVGTNSPNGRLAVIPNSNPITVATANTLTLGETSNNSAYQLRLAYAYLSSVYTGVIDAVQNSLGAPLSINPTGGATTIGGTLTSGALTITGSPATAIANGGTTGTGNIGASGATFNTVFAKATTAQYADLAEMYASDAAYQPGTVVDFGGTQEITISATAASDRVAGVVSTDPAHLMNSTQTGDHVIAVALTGRVPTRVTGTVWKGAMMISAGNGHARACATPTMGTVIGKSLEDFSGDSGMIHVVVGRL
jgi:hypothetical protein